MNEDNDNIDLRYSIEEIEKITGIERKRLNQEIQAHWKNRPILPIRQNNPINVESTETLKQNNPARTNLLDGILMDWKTNSPISPVSLTENDTHELYTNMAVISYVRDNIGRTVTEIDNAKLADTIFKNIRRITGVHQKDVFDEEWEGYQHITEAYPYASMKFEINMNDGLDRSGRLTTFTQDDMTVFADSNNMFWYKEGLLLYASNLERTNDELTDVFIFSDEKNINSTQFHNFNESFYRELRSEGKDKSTNPIMQHLRSLYSDNDGNIVKEKLNENIKYNSVGIESIAERIAINKLICDKVDSFSKKNREELVTDKSLESFIQMSLQDIQRETSNLLNRGKTPLYKLKDSN